MFGAGNSSPALVVHNNRFLPNFQPCFQVCIHNRAGFWLLNPLQYSLYRCIQLWQTSFHKHQNTIWLRRELATDKFVWPIGSIVQYVQLSQLWRSFWTSKSFFCERLQSGVPGVPNNRTTSEHTAPVTVTVTRPQWVGGQRKWRKIYRELDDGRVTFGQNQAVMTIRASERADDVYIQEYLTYNIC